MIKKIVLIVIVILAAWFWIKQSHQSDQVIDDQTVTQYTPGASDSEKLLEFAFQNRQSDIQVQGKGTVITLLKDDNEGSRHQRFIIQLSNQQTLLIAHNIDLAPRINTLRKGDLIEFFGEYEWNKKGGVIHWTHHDPKKRHPDGWLKHKGKLYQ